VKIYEIVLPLFLFQLCDVLSDRSCSRLLCLTSFGATCACHQSFYKSHGP
jgi:hypothetical protein